MALVGRHFADADNTQNTVLCLFAPDAPGIAVGEFPGTDSVHFGTRPGRRRLVLPDLALQPESRAVRLVSELYLQETGTEIEPDLLARMVWEYRNVVDGHGLAAVMVELAGRHPPKPGAAKGAPRLPVFADLMQALNVAAADTRAVVVLVPPAGDGGALEDALARVLFEEGVAGRAHAVRLTPAEWEAARASGQVAGGEQAEGVFVVAPDPFGLEGEVWREVAADADRGALRDGLVAGLDDFRARWSKLDRKSHVAVGLEQGITWTEYDPDACAVLPIGEGSKKLGEPDQVRHQP